MIYYGTYITHPKLKVCAHEKVPRKHFSIYHKRYQPFVETSWHSFIAEQYKVARSEKIWKHFAGKLFSGTNPEIENSDIVLKGRLYLVKLSSISFLT